MDEQSAGAGNNLREADGDQHAHQQDRGTNNDLPSQHNGNDGPASVLDYPSLVELSDRVKRLESQFAINSRNVQNSNSACIDKDMVRIGMSFKQSLKWRYSSLVKRRKAVMNENRITFQVHTHSSAKVDCMLSDFRRLSRDFKQRFGDDISFVPNRFDLFEERPSETQCVSVVFRNFRVMCRCKDVIGRDLIDGLVRVKKEKRNGRNGKKVKQVIVSAIQVAGIIEDGEAEDEKIIFVGEGRNRHTGKTSEGNVVTCKNSELQGISFSIGNGKNYIRSMCEDKEEVSSEFALEWTVHPLYKKNQYHLAEQVCGKVTNHQTFTIVQGKHESMRLLQTLTDSTAEGNEGNPESRQSFLYRYAASFMDED